MQHDIDLGSERVIVNCYLGFHFEFFFWMLTLVDVTIFTGSSRMKSCSSFLTVGKTLTFFQSKYNVFSFKTLSASSCNEYVTNQTQLEQAFSSRTTFASINFPKLLKHLMRSSAVTLAGKQPTNNLFRKCFPYITAAC